MELKLAVIVFLFSLLCNVLANDLDEGTSCDLTDGTVGVCMKLSACRHANEDLKNFALPKICSLNLWDPIVCCLDCNFLEDSYTAIANPPAKRGDYGNPFREAYVQQWTTFGWCNEFYDVSVQLAFKFQFDVNIVDSEKANLDIAEDKRKKLKCLEAAHIIQHFPCNKYEGFQDLDNSVRCYDNPYDTESLETTHEDMSHKQPHLALIGYGDTPDYAGWPCSGSIISDQYILTAAHCTSSPALGVVKYAAMGNLQRTDHRRDWQIYAVVDIIVHPNYEPPSKYHDIALLKTRDKIRYNLEVIPACLQRDTDMAEVATATGWGAMGHQQHPADILREVDILKFSDKECLEAYPKHRHLINGYINTIQACYGDEDHTNDNCEGDSGGFLQIRTNKKKAKCLHTIIGITSYGRACGLFGSAGLYTRVAAYVPWIESITGMLS